MFRSSLNILNKLNITKVYPKADVSTSSTLNEKWDLLTAVCLERKALINPELTTMQKEYKQYLSQIEFERSLKSDFELRNELELKQIEKLKKGGADAVEINLKHTAQDFIDASIEELNQFKLASRITDADKKNDVKSLNRKLDKDLVLVLKQKISDQEFFLLPQCARADGETLRQTAERVIKEHCGDDIKAQFYGNAPSGFYKYKYPKSVRSSLGADGAKVFIYFARHIKGQLPEKSADFKWLDRKELQEILPRQYENSVSQMLLEE